MGALPRGVNASELQGNNTPRGDHAKIWLHHRNPATVAQMRARFAPAILLQDVHDLLRDVLGQTISKEN